MLLKKLVAAVGLSLVFIEEGRAQNITHTPPIQAQRGAVIAGSVIRNVDGDTFHLQGAQGRYIIRVWGVNAPERNRPFYNVASDFMRVATANVTVNCIVVDVDRYNRMVARCNNPQGDLGEQIVAAGLAIDYRRFSRGAYCRQEVAAQEARLGLWENAGRRQPSERTRCP